MKVYKVCSWILDDNTIKYVSSTPGNPYRIVYKIGEKAVPPIPGSYLFVFPDLCYAHWFMSFGRHEILECLGPDSAISLPFCSFSIKTIVSFWEEHWLDRKSVSNITKILATPVGTIGVEWLIPQQVLNERP